MPQLQRTTGERAQIPARQTTAGADVFEDLFTSFFGGPGKPGAALGFGVPGAPIFQGAGTGLRGLSTVAQAPGTGLTGGKAGMTGGNIELPLQKLLRMARGISRREQDIPDIAQSGTEAALRKMQKTSMSGQDILKTARGEMKNWRPENTRAVGARGSDKRLVEKVELLVGDQGHDRWVAKLQEMDPGGNWDLAKLRAVQQNVRQPNVRLDQKSGRGLLPQLRAQGDPAQRAEAIEAYNNRLQLPDRPIAAAEQLIVDAPKAGKLRGIAAKKKGTTVPPKPREISGGAGDQFTQPDRPAFSTHSLYNVKQNLGRDPITGETPPPVSPREMLGLSQDSQLGPGMEMFFGQGSVPPGMPTSPVIAGPAGARPPVSSPDFFVPGPHPGQSYSGFQQLQRMLMDALFKSGRN